MNRARSRIRPPCRISRNSGLTRYFKNHEVIPTHHYHTPDQASQSHLNHLLHASLEWTLSPMYGHNPGRFVPIGPAMMFFAYW